MRIENGIEIHPHGYWPNGHPGYRCDLGICDWIAGAIGPKATLYDLGCGNGAYVEALRGRGVQAFGFDGRSPDRQWCYQADLAEPLADCWARANVMSIDVAEHIPAEYTDQYIKNVLRLVAPGGLLVVSWGYPGQPGEGHDNCLWPAEWHRYFAGELTLEPELSNGCRASSNELPWLATESLAVWRRPL